MSVDEGDHHGKRGSSSRAKETRRRQEDLVGPAQLADLTLQLADALCFGRRHPGAAADIDLGQQRVLVLARAAKAS